MTKTRCYKSNGQSQIGNWQALKASSTPAFSSGETERLVEAANQSTRKGRELTLIGGTSSQGWQPSFGLLYSLYILLGTHMSR